MENASQLFLQVPWEWSIAMSHLDNSHVLEKLVSYTEKVKTFRLIMKLQSASFKATVYAC